MVKLKSISKKYENKKILDKFNCEFENNIITCLYGPSGCGKTTLLDVIAGLSKVDGVVELPEDKKVSYVFQEDRLLPWKTVIENIVIVLKNIISKEEAIIIADKYIKLVGLEEYRDSYPDQLSGGMKRRVSIARAFSYPSKVLLLDEPFKGLDKKLKEDIIKDFLKIWKDDKRTVLFVTHDKLEADMLSDKIYYLEGLPLKIVKVE